MASYKGSISWRNGTYTILPGKIGLGGSSSEVAERGAFSHCFAVSGGSRGRCEMSRSYPWREQ